MYTLEPINVARALVEATKLADAPGVYPEDSNYKSHASVDALLDHVRSGSEIPIILREVTYQGEYICARMERYKDRIEISVNSNQDEKWKRFAAIKELAHLKIDTIENCSPYGDERIEELCRRGLLGLASEKNHPSKPATQSEFLAEIAAIQIMYPYRRAAQDIEEHMEKRVPILRVSLERQMPEHYVATALDIEYMTFLNAAFQLLNGENSKAGPS